MTTPEDDNQYINTSEVTLTREELFVLLKIIQAPGLLGLERGFSESVTAEQAAAALVAGELSLKARSFLRINEEEKHIEINPLVLAVLGTCLAFETALIVLAQKINAPRKIFYLHNSKHLGVMHSTPSTGLHNFQAKLNIEAFVPEIIELFELKGSSEIEPPELLIHQNTLEQVKTLIQAGDLAGANTMLVNEGNDFVESKRLIETIKSPLLNGSIIRLELVAQPNQRAKGLAILVGDQCSWTLETGDDHLASQVKVNRICINELQHRINTLLISKN